MEWHRGGDVPGAEAWAHNDHNWENTGGKRAGATDKKQIMAANCSDPRLSPSEIRDCRSRRKPLKDGQGLLRYAAVVLRSSEGFSPPVAKTQL